MVAVRNYEKLQARTSDDWCTLADGGGFNVTVAGRPLAFIALAAGNIVIQGRSGNSITLSVTAMQFVDLSVTTFVSSGSTLTDTQIILIY